MGLPIHEIKLLIRSAVSFNIDGIIVKKDIFQMKVFMYKAASGAIEYLNIFEVSI